MNLQDSVLGRFQAYDAACRAARRGILKLLLSNRTKLAVRVTYATI